MRRKQGIIAALVISSSIAALSACVDTPREVIITPTTIQLQKIGGFRSVPAAFEMGAAEIPAYDPITRRAFIVNGASKKIDVLNLSAPAMPAKIGEIDLTPLGDSPNSVAVCNGLVAVAVQNATKTSNGTVGLFDANANFGAAVAPRGMATVGALPDMLTFTPDCSRVLVANEGEPNHYGHATSIDPEGSVSILNVSNPAAPTVQTATFTAFNTMVVALRASGVRIFGPGASVAQDLEPEYITVAPDGLTAVVSLQEANAFGLLNIATATFTDIRPLGLKNHALAANPLDASDRDNTAGTGAAVSIRTQPVFGMFQPDTIASYTVGGTRFVVTANEGDSRDYPAPAPVPFTEEVRAGAAGYVLDPVVFPTAVDLKMNRNLGRLTVTNQTGSTDADAEFEQIHVFGARSFSIFREDGTLVFDSGSDFETRLAATVGVVFNSGHTNNALDDRSDNKGPEPEALALGTLGRKTFAFIGLERDSGIMVYDITSPTAPSFVQYINSRNSTVAPSLANIDTAGDLGPEGIVFVPAADSGNGIPLLIVANEVSGTTAIYQINQTF